MKRYQVLIEDLRGGWNVINVTASAPETAVGYGLRSTHWARAASLLPANFEWFKEGRRYA